MMSDLSFHCLICYEAFNNTDLFPVVLPCSHTYICNVCADRIERCMECRTSLFLPENKPKPEVQYRQTTASSYTYSRHGRASNASYFPRRIYTAHPQVRTTRSLETPSKIEDSGKKERQRFPLPKNLVLLSLMEAIQNAGENEKNAMKVLAGDGSSRSQSKEKGEEEINIDVVTTLASSTCGTYIVSSKVEVPLFSHAKDHTDTIKTKQILKMKNRSPNKNSPGSSKKQGPNTVIEQDVRKILEDMDLNADCTCHYKNLDCSHASVPIDKLMHGDKVQVVTIVDNWAVLARRRGIVPADKLIKVGPPVDEACRLEGILISLSEKEESLIMQQNDTKRSYSSLLKDVKKALATEDLTITRAPIKEPEETPKPPEEDSASPVTPVKSKASEYHKMDHKENEPKRSAEKRYHAPNFRTGMSGHKALTHYNKFGTAGENNSRSHMMSSHAGLSIPGNLFRAFYGADKRDTENSPGKGKSSRF